jgi:hypothetical protein
LGQSHAAGHAEYDRNTKSLSAVASHRVIASQQNERKDAFGARKGSLPTMQIAESERHKAAAGELFTNIKGLSIATNLLENANKIA